MDFLLKYIIINNLKVAELEDLNSQPLILIPEPKEISTLSNRNIYELITNSPISFKNVDKETLLFENLTEALNELSNTTIKKLEYNSSNDSVINKNTEKDLLDPANKEAYNLIIKEKRILIFSKSDKGLFYGLQTFIQMIKNSLISTQSENGKRILLPEILIKDAPDLGMRGVAQDISRGQVCTVDNAKRYIKILSHYKMNAYCLYIEDMFAHPDHPKIGNDRGAFTCEEIREIDTYAKKHFVKLIPIFECLGHMDNILQHKEYRDLGEFPGAHSLDISNPDIFPFLTDFISELSRCFSTSYFHIGCDESFDVGKFNSKKFIKKQGMSKAVSDFYNKIYEIARNRGNEYVIMYDDMIRKDDEILEQINKNLILMYWEYSPNIKNPPVKKFIDAGHRVIVSPSMLNWNRNFPCNKNASQNIINMIDLASQFECKDCLGVLTSTWGDQRYFSLRENEIFGAIVTSAKAWNVNKFDYEHFKKKYGYLFYGLNRQYLETFNELFTILSSSAQCYYRLRMLLPPLFYTDFFKHPFPSKNFKPGLKKYRRLNEIGVKSLTLYQELVDEVSFEKENFEYIQFGAELAKYCGEKITISVEIKNQLKKRNLRDQQIQGITNKLHYIKNKISYLKQKYEILWLRAAKRSCLEPNLVLFDRLIQAYNDKIEQLSQNVYFKSPHLESEWIWIHEKVCPLKPRFFRKEFTITNSVKKAMLQGAVCTHMKIFINEKYIGEVLGRFSLSRLPILLRVQVFDITKYLKQGKNVIAVEAVNYDGFKGGINVFGQIQFDDDSMMEIKSDTNWICSRWKGYRSTDQWKEINFKTKLWFPVKSYGPPPNLNGDMMKPNLLNGEISLTQDYFGAQGYYYNAVELFFGRIRGFLLRNLITTIIKLAKLFG
ncbi:MAG: hypothetical protein BAJALOKI1v1_1770005 [Promethearchaeota archaeon]|nr:MAG: hypothetical protein BAJALOKI1v1_1770005 [Candidatus Lokiarchaeota archaeon]